MKDVIIGLDAGTSVIKSIAFDLSGRQLAVSAVDNQYQSMGNGGVEQDMARTWQDAATSLRGLAEQIPDLAGRSVALAVTGQGDGTWLSDANDQPVTGGWLWLDSRAADIVEKFNKSDAASVRFNLTGTGFAACQQAGQLLWMQEHTPELIENSVTAMHCKDWLYLNFTGERATDPSEGCFTFGDYRTRQYSDEVIDALGLASCRRLLPPIVDGIEQSMPLCADAAAATGLLEGMPVVLGYVDVICTALGAGLYDKEATPGCTIVGSTGIHMRLVKSVDDVLLNEARTGFTMPMPIPGVYAQMQSNMASTLNIDWLLDVAADLLTTEGLPRSRTELIASLDKWVSAAAPASLIYQPYISEAGERGPFIDANARAAFIGLSTQHRYPDLVRAVFEGIAYAARDCYQCMGPMPDEVRVTGGAARSSNMRSILGSVLNCQTRTSSREEAGAAGAAMIAAVSIGHYDSMDACAADWVDPLIGEPEAADPELAELYQQIFPAYVESHRALQPVWATMANANAATGVPS